MNPETRLPPNDPTIRFGEYVIDPQSLCLLRGMDVIHTTAKQIELLALLLEAKGEVVSRITLMDRLWRNAEVEEHNITQTVFRLRCVLGKLPNGKEYIETIPRRGYRMSSASLAVLPLPSDPTSGKRGARSETDQGPAQRKIFTKIRSHRDAIVIPPSWSRTLSQLVFIFAILARGSRKRPSAGFSIGDEKR
ncbi:winged helix-turn-helix domain-containing protein [Terriglobus albidus]|uniref:winged helix-turn-helix domain-containing protein n=1 Tax=Terriglobus albidus TaxID=1592106 RepID=UPI00164DA229|nr:winged helix-turn-helix domain-containing protein [Terriglobus albidus]